jgi:hypothetical protein
MDQTQLFGVVFESFTSQPVDIFGIDIGPNCTAAPVFDSGVTFLGNWTARIHNPVGEWIAGAGTIFQRSANVPVGANGQYGQTASIQLSPLKIFSFKPQIAVDGSFQNNETVSVRIRIEYIDNTISNPIVKTFTSTSSVWLSDNEMLALYPSQSIIWAILIDATSSQSSTNAAVTVNGYGTAG